MKIGKLYKNIDPTFFWFAYPTKEKAEYMAYYGGNFDSTKMAAAWLAKGLIDRFNL